MQYNSVNVKLSDSQLNKYKSRIKNATEITVKLWSNMIGDPNDDTNFPHKLLLTGRQVSKLLKVFASNSSANTKLSKTQLSKTVYSCLLKLSIKVGSLLMKNALKPLAKIILIPLRLTVVASSAATGIHKNIFSFWGPFDFTQRS